MPSHFARLVFAVCLVGLGAPSGASLPPPAAETQEVKSYLFSTLLRVQAASAGFVEHANAYAALLASAGGPAEAWEHRKDEVRQLIAAMQEDYLAMDSYGYESVEGIVAGVERFAKYDLYLDGGLPKGQGDPKETSPLTLRLATGEVIAQEGSSFTYIIEPALWGGNRKWCVLVSPEGGNADTPAAYLPRPEVLHAVAVDTAQKLGELMAEVRAWHPTSEECFQAMVAIAPTLSDCFADWKESRYSDQASGRFSAVSRVSDMRGIIKSCAVMFRAVEPAVRVKDKPLARVIDGGVNDLLVFLEWLEKKESATEARFRPVVLDELFRQAKAKTDQLVPQLKQAAALVGAHVRS